MQRFEDRAVLVTGAGAGIGQASAIRIAAEGGTVGCADINRSGVEDTVTQIKQAGGAAVAIHLDVADPESTRDAVKTLVEQYGKLNALCNIAGILRFDNTLDLDIEDFNRVIQVNLTGTLLMCQAAIPHLLKTKGSIVNMASTAAHGAHAWSAAYAASKGGVMAMSRSLAIEFGKQGLNVNTLSPASVQTAMSTNVELPEGADMSLLDKAMPFDGVFRPPSDVAGLIAFLASDDAVHINGIDVRIDGGMML